MDLDTMTRAEMLGEAKRRGIKGLKDSPKAEIRAALDADVALDAADEAPAVEDAAAPVEPVAPIVVGLTDEQRAKLRAASVGDIEHALSSRDFPAVWRAAFEMELASRTHAPEMVPYKVTVGGPYVPPGGTGYRTFVPKDTIVYETTHNLDDLRAQGIVVERAEGTRVVTVSDMLGFPTTELQTAG